MYEQAMRYSLECDTAAAVQARYDCLLSCVNSLNLVDPKYAWIAKPIINEDGVCGAADTDDAMSIGDRGGDEQITINQQQVVVLGIPEIRRELLLAEATVTLLRHRQDLGSILTADAEQIIGVLSNSGLYTAAVRLARGLANDMIAAPLDALTSACIRADSDTSDTTWNWLKENDLADVPHRNCAAEMAWHLLQRLVDDNEVDTDATRLHKVIATRCIKAGEYLPHWLQSSYQRRNPTELLMLLVTNGRLLEASELAVALITAMMRVGGEYFGLANSLHILRPPLCFPVNAVDLLLHGLKLNRHQDHEYEDMLTEVKAVVECYIGTAQRISENKIAKSW